MNPVIWIAAVLLATGSCETREEIFEAARARSSFIPTPESKAWWSNNRGYERCDDGSAKYVKGSGEDWCVCPDNMQGPLSYNWFKERTYCSPSPFRGSGMYISSQADRAIDEQVKECNKFIKLNKHGQKLFGGGYNFTSCFAGYFSFDPIEGGGSRLGLYNCDFKDRIGRLYIHYLDMWGERGPLPHDFSESRYTGLHTFYLAWIGAESAKIKDYSFPSIRNRLWKGGDLESKRYLLIGLSCLVEDV